MFIAVIIVLLALALASADFFVSQYNSEELRDMGVQEK